MDPTNGQPLFDPTNPKKPMYLDKTGAVYTPEPLEQPLGKKANPQLQNISLRLRIMIVIIFIVIGIMPAIIDATKQSQDPQPPTGSIISSSDENTISAGDYEDSAPLQATNNSDPQNPNGPLIGPGSSAADDERKADLGELYKALNDYYFLKGQFPTFTNLNDATWRKANVPSIDAEWLRDPTGPANTLSIEPAVNAYSYSVIGNDHGACNNSNKSCQAYRLTAILSDGMPYYLDSL